MSAIFRSFSIIAALNTFLLSISSSSFYDACSSGKIDCDPCRSAGNGRCCGGICLPQNCNACDGMTTLQCFAGTFGKETYTDNNVVTQNEEYTFEVYTPTLIPSPDAYYYRQTVKTYSIHQFTYHRFILDGMLTGKVLCGGNEDVTDKLLLPKNITTKLIGESLHNIALVVGAIKPPLGRAEAPQKTAIRLITTAVLQMVSRELLKQKTGSEKVIYDPENILDCESVRVFYTRVFTRILRNKGVSIIEYRYEYKDWDDHVPQVFEKIGDAGIEIQSSTYINTGFTPAKNCKIYCCD